MSLPILICSKARPAAPLFGLLRSENLPYHVIVEPQDLDAYREAGHACLAMDEDDRGLAYARQYALDVARGIEKLWPISCEAYWMLDDDISSFSIAEAETRRNRRIAARTALSDAERFLEVYEGVGIVSLEYSQYAWNARPKQVSWNSYCDCAVLIRTDVMADYRQELPLKVDRDFTLQVLASGMRTARLRDVSFQVPTNGSNKGGLHDRYADGIEAAASRMMEELWPGVCEAKVKPNGRPDVKIHWRRIAPTGARA